MNVSNVGIKNITGIVNINSFSKNMFHGDAELIHKLAVQIEDNDLINFMDVFYKFPDRKTDNNFLRLEAHSRIDINPKQIGEKFEDIYMSQLPAEDLFTLNEKPLDFNRDCSVMNKIIRLTNQIFKSKEPLLMDKNYVESDDYFINTAIETNMGLEKDLVKFKSFTMGPFCDSYNTKEIAEKFSMAFDAILKKLFA